MGNTLNRTALLYLIDKAKVNIPKEDQYEYQPIDTDLGVCLNWIYYKFEDKKILVEFWSKPNTIRRTIETIDEENNKSTYYWHCCNCQNRYHYKCVNNTKESIIHY